MVLVVACCGGGLHRTHQTLHHIFLLNLNFFPFSNFTVSIVAAVLCSAVIHPTFYILLPAYYCCLTHSLTHKVDEF